MGLTNYIEVELNNDHDYNCNASTIARKGENKASALRLKLTDEMLDKYIYLAWEKPNGDKIKTGMLTVDVENKTADFYITNQLTDEVGLIMVEIVIESADGLVWKSYSKRYYIADSIDAVVELSPEKVDWLTQTEVKLEKLTAEATVAVDNANTLMEELIAARDNGEFNGVGVPLGGTTGQVLAKSSNDDYSTEWVNPSGSGGGTTNYEDLVNKPSINSVMLTGNQTSEDLGFTVITNVELEKILTI